MFCINNLDFVVGNERSNAMKTSSLRFQRSVREKFGLLLLSLVLMMTGCEKLRSLTYEQGQGENLFLIKDFNSVKFEASTGIRRFKGQTSRADELEVPDDFEHINSHDAVTLSFEQGLFSQIDLKDLIFYGRENHKYIFQYDFTDDYVILSKVANRKDIPSQELTFAENLGLDTYKVPIMGLPISLYTVELVEDERGKKKRRLNEYDKLYLKEASHFRINPEGIKYFETTGKQDLIPTDYFDSQDEWFYYKTLVGRPINSDARIGQPVAKGKIRFARTNNSLIGVDVNIAEEQEVLDDTKRITLLEIPVEWVDFRLERSGDDAFLRETKLGNEEPSSKFWMDRAFALVDFNNADRLDKAFTLDNKLEKLQITDDYLSFNIFESSTGFTYKYSLAKVNRRVEGQKLFADDATHFHIFANKRKVMGGTVFEQIPDIENIVYSSRFFPNENNPEIVYHLSNNSPDVPEFNEAVEYAIQAWDNAFKEAGTNIRVIFSEDRVELGDVRYNQVILYGYEIDSGNLLGYGPSLQDTRTGETYSATTHIYLRQYREGLIRGIRSFVRNEIGLYDDKKIAAIERYHEGDAAGAGSSSDGKLSGNATGRSRLIDYLNSDVFEPIPDFRNRVVDKLTSSQLVKKELEEYRELLETEQTHDSLHSCEHANVAARSISWDRIRKACMLDGHEFKNYIDRLKTANAADPNVYNVEGEQEAIFACAQPLMKDLLTSTLIHEIGHNLGLGHNFAASSDWNNHARNDDGTEAFPSSSVMDYPDRDYDLYSKLGPYDVAAIAYLYGRTVKDIDGERVPIGKNQSIEQAAKTHPKKLKNYRMCTDYEVDYRSNLAYFDPLCKKWDYGTNPRAYVEWAIRKIHAEIIEKGNRYNSAIFYGSWRAETYFDHFRQIHDYFRYLLSDKGLFFEEIFFTYDSFTKEEQREAFEEVFAGMGQENAELARAYYDAVELIFEFSRDLINLPSRVCLVESSAAQAGKPDVVEFRIIRNRIFKTHNVTVQSCREAAEYYIKDNIKNSDQDNFTLSDRGNDNLGLEVDLDPAAASAKFKQYEFHSYDDIYYEDFQPLLSSGLADIKKKALQTLLERQKGVMALTELAQVSQISFVDFPWFRDVLFQDSLDRIVEGIKGEQFDDILKNEKYPHYREYVDELIFRLSSLLNAADRNSLAYDLSEKIKPWRASTFEFTSQSLPNIEEQKLDYWHYRLPGKYNLYVFGNITEKRSHFVRLAQQIDQLPDIKNLLEKIDVNNENRIDVLAALDIQVADDTGNLLEKEVIVANVIASLKDKLDFLQPQLNSYERSFNYYFQEKDPTKEIVSAHLKGFLETDPAVLDGIIRTMSKRGENENITALKTILLAFFLSY